LAAAFARLLTAMPRTPHLRLRQTDFGERKFTVRSTPMPQPIPSIAAKRRPAPCAGTPTRLHIAIALLGGSLALPGAGTAAAADRQTLSCTAYGTAKADVLDLGGEHSYIVASNAEDVVCTGIPDGHPAADLSGTCSGAMEFKGKTGTGGGYCSYENPRKGKWVMKWTLDMAGDATHGTYEMEGVAGDAAGWKGAGTWHERKTFPGSRYIDQWDGWVEKR
jgi:hypothetical protein